MGIGIVWTAAFYKESTRISNLTDIQEVFEEIDTNPEGIKYLINCQE